MFGAGDVPPRDRVTSAASEQQALPTPWNKAGRVDLLNLHNCLDAMNTIHPMRLRAGSYFGLVSAIKLIDDRDAFNLGSIAIERVNEGTLAPSAEVAYVGLRERSNITVLAETGCKRTSC